jgi:hypothetical protein
MPIDILMPALSPPAPVSSFRPPGLAEGKPEDRLQPESRAAFQQSAALIWTPAFAGVTDY